MRALDALAPPPAPHSTRAQTPPLAHLAASACGKHLSIVSADDQPAVSPDTVSSPQSSPSFSRILRNHPLDKKIPTLIDQYLASLPPSPQSIPLLASRTAELHTLLHHLNPKTRWRDIHPSFHRAFRSLWSEFFTVLQRLKDVGGLQSVGNFGGEGGSRLGHDLRTRDFNPILLSLMHSVPPAEDSTDAGVELTIPNIVDFFSSVGVAPTARQLDLLLRYYTLPTIFSTGLSTKAFREARRNEPWDTKELAGAALKAWTRRRRLGGRVEALIRGVRTTDTSLDDPERWIDLPLVAYNPKYVRGLRLTLGRMTMTCLEEAISLKDLIGEEKGMSPEHADLSDELRYWTARRDAMIPEWREEVMSGLVREWEAGLRPVRPSKREQELAHLLLRDSLLQNLRYPHRAPDTHGAPDLNEPLELFRLMLGQDGRRPVDSLMVGRAVNRIRNVFYHQRSFPLFIPLIRILGGKSPCPPLEGRVISSLLRAARNPVQIAHLLLAFLKYPPPLFSVVPFDKSTRRLLFKFATDASTLGLDYMIPDALRKGGYRGLLLSAFEEWGTGMPTHVRVENMKKVDRRNHRIRVKIPRVLAQVTKGKHIE